MDSSDSREERGAGSCVRGNKEQAPGSCAGQEQRTGSEDPSRELDSPRVMCCSSFLPAHYLERNNNLAKHRGESGQASRSNW